MRKIERVLYKANELQNRLEHLNIMESEIVEIGSIRLTDPGSKTNDVSNRTADTALSKMKIDEERIIIRKKLQHIEKTLEHLQEDDKEIIKLRYFDRYAWADIADHVAFSIRQCYRKRDAALELLDHEMEWIYNELC